MTATTFDALPSRTPLSKRRTAARVDPYWGGLWGIGIDSTWMSVSDARRRAESGVLRLPAWLDVTEDEARARAYDPRHREKVLRVIAAADLWRTATVEQLEAITDVTGLADGSRPLLATLWALGLVDIAVTQPAFARTSDRLAVLVRPSRPNSNSAQFEASLTWPEWVSVTCGTGLEHQRQYTRHNILATELGLRAAEFGRVGTVLGEKLAAMETLAYTGAGVDAPVDVRNACDLVLVRDDGLRIAVEVSASIPGQAFQLKVDKLLAILHRRSIQETGLAVLFVVAPHQDSTSAEVTYSLDAVKKAVRSAALRFPGTAGSPTAARVGVASWARWFPEKGAVDDEFPLLTVERPTGAGERVWESAAMLDRAALPFAPADGFDPLAVIANASGLRGVPEFLRRDERPELWRLALANAGFDRIPQVEGTRPLEHGTGGLGITAAVLPRLRFG